MPDSVDSQGAATQREAISQLKAHDFRFIDQKDRDNWATVFTDDIVVLVESALSNVRSPASADRNRTVCI